ncbi:hypothetical protein H2248_005263 [Termitomyces sp. 'cryptogamus']|nr:hypothetical protein H2248_005263 [Termitomyces sp. 'cryptogamus']
MPIRYHYANHPALSVDRVREIVFKNFDITPAGLPGNDDQAAMASLLAFHLLGLYPVPSTTEFIVLSPFIPKYTIHNSFLNVSTTVTTLNTTPSPCRKALRLAQLRAYRMSPSTVSPRHRAVTSTSTIPFVLEEKLSSHLQQIKLAPMTVLVICQRVCPRANSHKHADTYELERS